MKSNLLEGTGLGLCVIAVGLAYMRWLRVAQREHYLPGSAARFARRWWGAGPLNQVLGTAGAAGAVVSAWYPPAALAAVVAAGAGPVGLTLRGRTSKLAWTPRLRRLGGASVVVAAVPIGALAAVGLPAAVTAAALCAMAAPFLVDAALLLMKWPEARLLRPYVQRASQRLASVRPRIVAITGSYGKTTTKGYIAHLAAGSTTVVPTPASFNNTAGLARAINEHLATGTKVFVAEMGTYGPGEIAAMCKWAVPEIGVITAVGPVHIERMGTVEQIAQAKSEILERAQVAILNVDYPLLADLAKKAEDNCKFVWRCSSTTAEADVSVLPEHGKLHVRTSNLRGEMDILVDAEPEVEPGNVACAVAAALSLGVPADIVASRLADLPGAPHRRDVRQSANGVNVIDDTYNSNPAGADAATALLGTKAAAGRQKVVVTPGMVELGHLQADANARFAASAGAVATQLVVVGHTNARSLLSGATAAGLPARKARNLAEAVAWVSAHLGPGDAVLYENDLPDHYP
jgi:UDP-N-acetylmuramoyl-tripeptide--D-alanyl-D-alanine ligase